MKRFASLLLSAVMLLTLGVPAAASNGGTDQRLAKVTAKDAGHWGRVHVLLRRAMGKRAGPGVGAELEP